MENYKVSIKRRIILFSGLILLTAILGVYDFFISGNVDASMTDEVVSGFQFGLIFGLGILALIQVIKLNMVIRNDKKLKILYNKEHDERLKAIRSKAGMPMLMITSVMMVISAIIAGYFNIVVFYVLAITAMVQLSIGTIVKLYCMKTM